MPLSELRKPYERYAGVGRDQHRGPRPARRHRRRRRPLSPTPTQDRLDGLTVDLGDWWFNLRPSNTEPLLRLNLEAPDAEACARRVAEVQAIMERAGRDVGPG